MSKNIHRTLPQAESWREPSSECHHSATPTGSTLNTLKNKTGKESQDKMIHPHHSQFLNMLAFPSSAHLIQLILYIASGLAVLTQQYSCTHQNPTNQRTYLVVDLNKNKSPLETNIQYTNKSSSNHQTHILEFIYTGTWAHCLAVVRTFVEIFLVSIHISSYFKQSLEHIQAFPPYRVSWYTCNLLTVLILKHTLIKTAGEVKYCTVTLFRH